ncbi:hypothetical protein [Diaphorobacter nitroreducens]|uniref:hypothetical protein n=1 Tax=Diaphorobacter nitroreducens TaxID=164759 RepID=UPI0011E4CA39|nr:hypothetical protein [Diaphorobacter nitroreducens]
MDSPGRAPHAHPGPVQIWEELAKQSIDLFRRGETLRALSVCEAARVFVLTHFNCWPTPDNALAATLVSHFNLADTQARSGWLAEASATLCHVHGSLLAVINDAHAHPALRQAAARFVRRTLFALTQFQATHGERPEIARLLRQQGQSGCAAAAECDQGGDPETDEAPRVLH